MSVFSDMMGTQAPAPAAAPAPIPAPPANTPAPNPSSVYEKLMGTPIPAQASNPAPTAAPAPVAAPTAKPSVFSSLMAKPADSGKYFSAVDEGGSYGVSDQNDISGVPYFAYRAPGDTATTTDKTRVAFQTDPRIATTTPAALLKTPRMNEKDSSAIKKSMGGTPAQQLDHGISLELGGSNDKSNLRLEDNVPGTGNTPTDPQENALTAKVEHGQESPFQAQADEAKLKGLPIPFTGAQKNPGLFNKLIESLPAPVKQAAGYDVPVEGPVVGTQSPGIKDRIQQVSTFAQNLGATVLKYISASDTSPLPEWFTTAIAHPIATGQGGVQASLQAADFFSGIGDSIVNQGLNPLFHIPNTPETEAHNAFGQLAQMNSKEVDRTPQEQEAYDIGNFLGWMVPYSKVAKGAELGLDALHVAAFSPRLAKLIPFVSNAVGFLGTGQILHTPDEGSRVQQLKNDTITLALFEVGGWAIKGAAGAASKGFGSILPAATKDAATEAMKPVVDAIEGEKNITADALDSAVTEANSIIEESTGKTPQELLRSHLDMEQPTLPEGHPATLETGKAIEQGHATEVERAKVILDDLKNAKARLDKLNKEIEKIPAETAKQTPEQKATVQEARALHTYVTKNADYVKTLSEKVPSSGLSRMEHAASNPPDMAAIDRHTAKYTADVKQVAGAGFKIPENVVSQDAEFRKAVEERPTMAKDSKISQGGGPVSVSSLESALSDAYKNAGSGRLSHEKPVSRSIEAGDHFNDFGETSTARDKVKARIAEEEARTAELKFKRALAQIKAELELSQPGYRVIGDHTHGAADTHGVSSTFPKWLSPELRSTSLFNKLLALLDSEKIQYPTGRGTKMRALYNEILDHVDHMTGVDTKEIRDKIMASYEKPATNEKGSLSRGDGEAPKDGERGAGGREGTGTQRERVAQVLRGEAKTIKQVAKETKLLEPNIRRILGVGAKEGTFERVDKGVYRLSRDGRDIAYIETGSSIESLPRLAKEGFKADMVFLDIPYNTPAVKGGNRGVKYDLISVDDFKKVAESLQTIMKTPDSMVVHMYSQAKSGLAAMAKYNKVLDDAGFKPVARGEYTKLQQDGISQVRNMRGDVMEPEGIIVYNKTGKLPEGQTETSSDGKYTYTKPNGADFRLVRPKGYQTEKPAEMLRALIELSSKEGDIVLDPFAGSGVTGAEAVKAGRVPYLIEKNADTVENVIKPRIAGAKAPDHIVEANKKVELPEFPNESTQLRAEVFPGASSIGKFVEKDILDRFPDIKTAAKGIYEAGKKMFEPDLGKEKAAAVVGKNIMQMEQYASAAWKKAENQRDWWAKLPEDVHNDFIDRMESGAPQVDTTDLLNVGDRVVFQDMADEYKARLNKAYDFETDAGINENYIQEYFPHMWKDPEEAARKIEAHMKAMGRGYREAFGSFAHIRIVELDRIGREIGLVPITTNPEERVLQREIDGMRVSTKIKMMHELSVEGLAHERGDVQYGTHANWVKVKGADGHDWQVAPDAAKILNNAFFGKSFWTMPGVLEGFKKEGAVGVAKGAAPTIFRSLMAVKGLVIPFKLALSAFHPIHVVFINSSSKIANAFEGVLKGGMEPAEALGHFGSALSQASIIKDVHDQWDVKKWWDTPLDQIPEPQRTTIQWIIDGGGTPKMSEEFKIRAGDGLKKALADENHIGAFIRMAPKLIEGYQNLTMGWIPKAKVASYIQAARIAVKANPELLTDDTARQMAFRKIWKDMDYRFGHVVYKTKFWNPMVKESLQASMLSLGWTGGFIDQFGGAVKDAIKFGVNTVTGRATAKDFTNRLIFASVYTTQAALVGGLMTYAMTGERPKDVKDYFFPRTGDTNPDGSPARLNTSFYTREAFSLAYHWQTQGKIGGSISMAENKGNPVLNNLAEIYNNKDFYGYQIQDTNHPAATRAAEVLGYFMKNAVDPISVAGAQAAAPVTGTKGQILSYLGFNPAPNYLAATPIQMEISKTLSERSGGTKPLESRPITDAKNNIRRLYVTGDKAGANAALKDAVDKGYIKPTGVGTFISSLDEPGDVRAFKMLTQYPTDQETLLAKMTESELARYVAYANSSVKAHLSSLSPTAKKFVDDLNAGRIQLDTFKQGKVVSQTL